MKKVLICIVSIALIILGVVRYNVVNAGVPDRYNEEKYDMGQWVKLDKYEVCIHSYEMGIDKHSHDVINAKLSIKNISNKDIDATSLFVTLQLMKGSIGTERSNFIYLDEDKIPEYFKSGQTLDMNIGISILNADSRDFYDKSKEIRLYLQPREYFDEVKEHFSNKELYIKYIKLR